MSRGSPLDFERNYQYHVDFLEFVELAGGSPRDLTMAPEPSGEIALKHGHIDKYLDYRLPWKIELKARYRQPSDSIWNPEFE